MIEIRPVWATFKQQDLLPTLETQNCFHVMHSSCAALKYLFPIPFPPFLWKNIYGLAISQNEVTDILGVDATEAAWLLKYLPEVAEFNYIS